MPAFIALLKGVNVGKANRVAMADLRSLLTGLGFTDVATLLNSGNAVFRAPSTADTTKMAAAVKKALQSGLQIDVPVIVKSAVELDAVVAENPLTFTPEDHSRVLVAFAPDAPSLAGLAPIALLAQPPEQLALGRHAAYLFCARGILESKAGEALLTKAGKAATSRNWATVLKLQALAKTYNA